MDVDEALLRIGTFNRWRIVIYSMICISFSMSGCWHMMSIVFIGAEPDHHCKLSENETLNDSIPLVLGKGNRWRYSQCTRFVNSSFSNTTTPCPNGWTYDRQEFEETIATEWDLVCDKNYLVETSQSVFSFGVMVGAFWFTMLADRIGRKPVMLFCEFGAIALGLAIAFSGNYIMFVALRFLQGALREGAGLVGIVMACELFPAVHRTFAGTALELFWATTWMVLALIAYLVRHWRYLQLSVTLPPIWTVSLIWLLPESVPWLVANDRVEEAESILRKAARHGGVQLPDPILQNHRNAPQPESENDDKEQGVEKPKQTDEEITRLKNSIADDQQNPDGIDVAPVDQKTGCCDCMVTKRPRVDLRTQLTCLDIMKSPTMVLYTIIMCSLWFASGLVYYGLSLSTSTLAGDRYVNFFLSGAVEVPAYALTIIVLKRFGRRRPLLVFHLTAATVLFANIFIPRETEGGVDLTPLIITLTMIGKFAMTAAFGTVVLYAPEIYPTNLRNFGLGVACVWARIGGIIAPFFSYISKTNDWIPSVVFTVIALVTGLMVLVLPETLDRPLPETIEEILSWKHIKLPRCKNRMEKKLKTNKQLDCLVPQRT